MATTPTTRPARIRLRRRTGLARVTGAALAASAVTASSIFFAGAAAAEPAPAQGSSIEALTIPFDSELAAAVRMLKAAGVDQMALQAAQMIIDSVGQVTPEMIIERLNQLGALQETPVADTTETDGAETDGADHTEAPQTEAPASSAPATEAPETSPPADESPADENTPDESPADESPARATPPAKAPAPTPVSDPLAGLRAAGVQTLTPSVAPFCTDPSADNPLGLVTAGAGAAAGPWPLKEQPLSFLENLIPGVAAPAWNLVDEGEVAYAFVPATATDGTGEAEEGTMQVAWFNTTTLEGGFADLKPLSDQHQLLKVLPVFSGVRLAPVKTGEGTILSAVYGSVSDGERECHFLPAVGVVEA